MFSSYFKRLLLVLLPLAWVITVQCKIKCDESYDPGSSLVSSCGTRLANGEISLSYCKRSSCSSVLPPKGIKCTLEPGSRRTTSYECFSYSNNGLSGATPSCTVLLPNKDEVGHMCKSIANTMECNICS
ncbi:hypothetical protein CROQUDRAFT_671182 [Cronartium quercuum f. sp. fusiforme G11]|uniref:Secreted protein n=1 Tax=Cronartium quercuum f. sp. fusiforme G11 TaxID=708437 RepID=A0A9P6NIV9_9BASI|nr:hypothetical protein CROQUDRAFT_671182 [Cronartium quercuum f. sp. fusiforme G11]